jgi:hypothetical protein
MLSQPVLLGLFLTLSAALVGRYLYRKDTEVEDRRRAANRLAGTLRAKGLKHVPEFLEDYGVGDYSGMAKKIHKAAVLLEDPAHAEALFDEVVDKALAARKAKLG